MSKTVQPPASLSSNAARTLSTTTKSIPQSQETTTRWLLNRLPWVQASGGVYRVTRRRVLADHEGPTNPYAEALIELASGAAEGQALPRTFADYDPTPREYALSSTQTILQIPVRVADLYNDPQNQTEQQLRLVIEAIRERQERELLHNHEFGLLHNVAESQRLATRSGPPTPDDLDELLCRRRQTHFLLASPQAIAAFGRQCSQRGLSLDSVELEGHRVPGWRGVPLLPCTKMSDGVNKTTSILAVRTGEDNGGVIGLHQTGLPDEYQPSLSVRFMGINDSAQIAYLVTAYYSVAVLLPDALGVLEGVEVGHYTD
ncbi:family 2B encapsulin nanocompartment shell protein [Pseudomonas gingeri]|uniref:family 2B encapsulin nanocompartment shell protein n=1 Tax=Pseudomonas gingeri TaxID=117681 RepID=UPI0015A133DE|nr:hypothetical protein [Pseudomonas gingeri]NWA00665.1 hypothetical protein [Pseudomonas gingeri]NWA16291.1 hypothetical protein [Pseudomonas gingeri]NWA54481.1 hypothetical protein [Pseudomonas gingeri]NWA97442.1 hypothetical protein [Pseudomonas gingeri]NWB04248.1 hypothetical protein [Pseudomonas gingeri]